MRKKFNEIFHWIQINKINIACHQISVHRRVHHYSKKHVLFRSDFCLAHSTTRENVELLRYFRSHRFKKSTLHTYIGRNKTVIVDLYCNCLVNFCSLHVTHADFFSISIFPAMRPTYHELIVLSHSPLPGCDETVLFNWNKLIFVGISIDVTPSPWMTHEQKKKKINSYFTQTAFREKSSLIVLLVLLLI